MDRIILVQEEPRPASQLVEIPVTANGKQRVAMPDVQQLRALSTQGVVIKAIRLITLDVLTGGMITGLANAPLAELQKMAFVFYMQGWERAQYIPALVLNDVSTPGGTFPHRYHNTRVDDWQNVDWSKSYIQYAAGTLSENAPYVVMLDVEYVKIDPQGNEIVGPS